MTSEQAEKLFIDSYVACALELLTDDEGEDLNKSREDIDPATLRCMEAEAYAFWYACWQYIADAAGQAGYDLWLTRNGHGSGFWDRNEEVYGDYATYLTNCAQRIGERTLYVGDDGKVYQMWG